MITTACPVRVLLIEDDRDDAWLTEQMLGQSPGVSYEVDWVESIEAAREALRRKAFDVSLVDHYLCDGNGLEFIRECVGASLGVPMILLTGRMDATADAEALAAGASDYLAKHEINSTLLDRAARYALEQARINESLRESQEVLKFALDSLASEVAILDEHGAILTVNEAWRNFARTGNLGHEGDGVGANYLDVCRKAMKEGDHVAGTVAQAIEDVRDNRWTSFSMEYPCAAPERERWFKLQIARFVVRGAVRVTVTHTDITENRQAVDRAIRSETRMRALLDCSTEIELLLDGEGRILYATPAIERVTGRTAELLVGHSNLDLVHSPDRGQAIVALNGGPGSSDPRRYRVRHSDGSLHWVEATIRNLLFDPEVRALVVNLRSLMSNVAG